MNWKGLFWMTAVLCFITAAAVAQTEWEMKQDKDGIKVFTKKMDSSPLKAVKVVSILNASPAALTAVLLDIKSSGDWVYATKKISLLKQVSPAELIYYSEIEIPWPVNNRDFIVLLKVLQDEKTKVISVVGYNKPDFVPGYKNIVRIQHSYSKWLITPLQNNQVKIEYILEVDPGGSVPPWLINLFATKGPYETFKKLREQVKKPIYQHASLPFLKE